jgi:hypothetical protein
MVSAAGFVLDYEWYWRIYEGDAVFDDTPGATAARDFLLPLAWLAKGRFVLDQVRVDADGNGVSFRVGEHATAIRCSGMRIDDFINAINASFAEAKLDEMFALVATRRYELRGVLVPRDQPPKDAVRIRARGTTPP